jgi:hypothetical protein
MNNHETQAQHNESAHVTANYLGIFFSVVINRIMGLTAAEAKNKTKEKEKRKTPKKQILYAERRTRHF